MIYLRIQTEKQRMTELRGKLKDEKTKVHHERKVVCATDFSLLFCFRLFDLATRPQRKAEGRSSGTWNSEVSDSHCVECWTGMAGKGLLTKLSSAKTKC